MNCVLRSILAIVLCNTVGTLSATATNLGKPVTSNSLRIIALGGAVTEIVFALGAGDRVVGVDASSSYPEEAKQRPKVAYHRRLSAEGILSLDPTLIIATTEAGPPQAIQQLESTGVALLILPHKPSVENTIIKIKRIAATLNEEATGAALINRLQDEIEQAKSYHPTQDAKAKVLFIYARGQGSLMVAGQNTGAETIIDLAGGVNAVQSYDGYKPLTSEAVVAAAPNAILLMDSGLESIGGPAGLWQLPGLAYTPAGDDKRVLSFNGLMLLGFGPRLGEAALALNQALYPKNSTDENRH